MGMGRSSNEELWHEVGRVCRLAFSHQIGMLPTYFTISITLCAVCNSTDGFLTVSRYRLSFCVLSAASLREGGLGPRVGSGVCFPASRRGPGGRRSGHAQAAHTCVP